MWEQDVNKDVTERERLGKVVNLREKQRGC
jgi:hypothetical protein